MYILILLSELKEISNYKETLIFYEAVHRIKNTLTNMLKIFGDRKICIGREISKLHEEYFRGRISESLSVIDQMKGEFVIIVEGNKKNIDYSNLDILEHVKIYLDEMSEMDAIKRVAKERGVAKSVIYSEYHNRK